MTRPTQAQHVFLTALTRRETLTPSSGLVTASTAKACEKRGWVKDIGAAVNGERRYQITQSGRFARAGGGA